MNSIVNIILYSCEWCTLCFFGSSCVSEKIPNSESQNQRKEVCMRLAREKNKKDEKDDRTVDWAGEAVRDTLFIENTTFFHVLLLFF